MLPQVEYLKKINKVWGDGSVVKSMYTVLLELKFNSQHIKRLTTA